jgi:hypothetical protein
MTPDPEFYNTIERTTTAEFKDRGSKFLAFTFPVQSIDDFKKCLEQIKNGSRQSQNTYQPPSPGPTEAPYPDDIIPDFNGFNDLIEAWTLCL